MRYLPTSGLFLVVIFVASYGFLIWQKSQFGKFGRFSVVVASPSVKVISLNLADKSATVVSFPDDFYVPEVVPGYGAYKVSSVYRVGELDRRGGQVLSWTISELLGVPIDKYLYRQDFLGADIKKSFLSPAVFFKAATDMTPWDLGRFILALEQTRFDKIKIVDLAQIAGPLVLADGSVAQGTDKDALDNVLSGLFAEEALRREGLRVEVVNSTKVAGLGARAARILTSTGMAVINVGTTAELLPSCVVAASQKNINSVTVRRAAAIFSCSTVTKTEGERADVTVSLGQDYSQRFK